jgi:hypothetical protein
MEKELISVEAAEKEWSEFLADNDARSLIPDESLKSSKIKEDREDYLSKKAGFDKVVRAISRGLVVIENGVIIQKLQYPISGKDSGQMVVDKLVFDKRWTVKDRAEIFKNVETGDLSQFFIAQTRFCAKITGIDQIILQRLDSIDFKITDQIVSVFFM